MTTDGGLRAIFQKKLIDFHWQGVEIGGTGRGVPDSNYCSDGIEGWIEFKLSGAWSVDLRPEQIAWIERRTRARGRVFIVVRRKGEGGPRIGPKFDELWLYRGADVRALAVGGMKELPPEGRWAGGVARWDWEAVRKILSAR